MSSSSDRKTRLRNLSRKLDHELDEDFRRTGNKFRDFLMIFLARYQIMCPLCISHSGDTDCVMNHLVAIKR